MALPATSAFAQNGSIASRWDHDGDLADSVGSNTLTNTGVAFASAQFGAQAGTYDGSDVGSVADAAGNSWTGDISMHMWVNRSGNPSSGAWHIIASKYNSTGNQRAWAYGIQNDAGTLKHYFIASSNGSATTTKSVALSNAAGSTDILLGFSYDASAGSVTFYEDGSKIGATQTGLPTSIHDSTAAFELGRWGNLANNYVGTLQDAILWTTALSDANHSDNYDAYFATAFTPKAIIF